MDCIEQIGLTDNRFDGKKNVDFIYPDLAGALLPVIDTFVEKAGANQTKYRRELGKLQKTEEEIIWVMGEYWMLLNNDLDPFNLVQELLDEKPQTLESVNTLMSHFTNWGNNVPRWILKGNTSNHTFETYERPELEKRPPQLIMGPNAREAGIKISQEELTKIREDEFQPPKGKVGRNAPCPCGSGRKYKNCCLMSNQ